jgi:divalent metal cation (Fe/Co/Zn/Cd) transporter
LNAVTIGWNVVEGVVAVTAGVLAGSVGLVGFGLDSGIEVSAALVLSWRLSKEKAGVCSQSFDLRAQRLVAASFAALAVYVGYESTADLVGGVRPEVTMVGIVIAALSLVVMPLLARAKARLAPVLGSRAAQAEAAQTDVCAWLSAALLMGLGAHAVLGWWWADPAAALVIAAIAAYMAYATWTADSLEDTCC